MQVISNLLLIIGIAISLFSVSISAQAYTCEWRNGQKICWHNNDYNGRHCHWVNGHWHNGYYYHGHNACWVN